jgi:hypothetical protein
MENRAVHISNVLVQELSLIVIQVVKERGIDRIEKVG